MLKCISLPKEKYFWEEILLSVKADLKYQSIAFHYWFISLKKENCKKHGKG